MGVWTNPANGATGPLELSENLPKATEKTPPNPAAGLLNYGAPLGVGNGQDDGVFRVGGGVTPPLVLQRVEPQYSEEARKARIQGTVVLEAIIRKDGSVDVMRIVKSLGYGLEENAIHALKQWRFKPGMRNGVPVDVALNIEVNFNLR